MLLDMVIAKQAVVVTTAEFARALAYASYPAAIWWRSPLPGFAHIQAPPAIGHDTDLDHICRVSTSNNLQSSSDGMPAALCGAADCARLANGDCRCCVSNFRTLGTP